jgi:hypothetical protein
LNSLSEEEKGKLIKYWGREKVRKELELADELEEQEKAGETLEKELELAKFHEERGKIKCACYDCENKKEIQGEIKEKMVNGDEKKQCSECQKWVKELVEDSGVCGKCAGEFE